MGKELAAMYPVARETFDEADAALVTSFRSCASKGRKIN